MTATLDRSQPMGEPSAPKGPKPVTEGTRGIGVQPLGSVDLLRLAQKKARTVLTSGGLEPVADVGAGGHSVFAKAFLDTLRENAAASDLSTLFGPMRRRVLR